MSVRAITLRRVELSLLEPVVTVSGTHDARPVVLVEFFTDDAVGIGECDALAEPFYTEEYADEAEATLRDELVPLLFRAPHAISSAEDALRELSSVPGHPMAKAAIEMAFLDAQLRASGVSLARHLGATRERVLAGATFGIASPEVTAGLVADAARSGYRRMKVKVRPGNDFDVLRRVREEFPDLEFVADANGSYRIDDAEDLERLRALDAFGLVALEQPFAAHDLVGHAQLREVLSTPILLDESAGSLAELDQVLAHGAADGVSIKPARLGGIAPAMVAYRRCVDEGLHLCVGGLFESGIARAALIALAALEGFDWPGDLGGSDRYFALDLTAPHRVVNGTLVVPIGPGLGIELRDDVIDALTTAQHRFEA